MTLLVASFVTCLRLFADIRMGCHFWVPLRRRYNVYVHVQHRGDVPLRRFGDVPPRLCWVFHLKLV